MSTPIVRPGDLVLERVRPGDLIKSDLINAIIQNIEALNTALAGVGGVGLVIVPNTIGRTLAEARAILSNPTTHMGLGGIIDVMGQPVSAVADEAQVRRVVSQVPPSGSRVTSGTAMSLVLSVRPGTGGGTTTSDKPAITNVSTGRINEAVTITGSNFELAREDNHVFFAGVEAEVPLTASRTILTVRVPEISLPGTGGGTEVDVLVRTPAGEAPGRATVLPKAEVQKPRVTGVSPTTVTEGGTVTITGTGFADTPSQNEVLFDAQVVRPTGGTAGSLTVVIPNTFSETFNVTAGNQRILQIRVRNTQTELTSDPDTSRSVSFFMPLQL
jgi:hypothetical protein